MRFAKYHALGNDYLVLDPADYPAWPEGPSEDAIRLICHRNFGAGSDGILWGPLATPEADFGLRIFNPDGSEAEKSGNGLRIFARYLHDRGLPKRNPFTIATPGGVVSVTLHDGAGLIAIEMGRVSFRSDQIPINIKGAAREVVNEPVEVDGTVFQFTGATVGNPHCVIPVSEATAALAHRFGPKLETHALFPRRTNVQFLQVLNRANIRIEIWERGAGYTLASGSSSSAAAAVARRLGLVDAHVTVHMPGGRLGIQISPDYEITMTGPVTRVADGTLALELLRDDAWPHGLPRAL